MAEMIHKPTRWLPGVRDSHPLARGLVGLWPFWEGQGGLVYDAGNPFDIANHGTLVDMDPPTDWAASPNGMRLEFDGADDRIDLGTAIGLQQYSGSVAVWFMNTGGGVSDYIFAHRAGGNQRIYLVIFNGRFFVGFANSFNAIDSGITVADDGLWHCAAATWNATDAFAYLDGKYVGTYNGTLSSAPVGVCRLGSTAEGVPAEFFQGSIGMAIASTRQWNAEEVQELCADPWGLITPRTKTYIYRPLGNAWYYYAQQEAAA